MSGRINPDEIIVAVGCSQVGKSTTIASLIVSGELGPRTGDGDGESCTSTVSAYDTVIGTLIDSPGWADTRLARSDDEWSLMIADRVISLGLHRRIKIIIFEAIANTHRTVRNNVERLRKALGREVMAGAVIVCTMADLVQGERREKVLRAVKQAAEESGIQEIVLWQNESIDDQGRREQVRRLQQSLGRVQGVQSEKVRTYQQQVEDRAKLLCEQQQVYAKTEKVTWQEKQAVPRTEKEQYTDVYVENEEQEQQFCELKAVEKTVKVPEVYQEERDGLLGLLFGGTQDRIRLVDRQETTYVPEAKMRKVQVPVARTRQAERDRTTYDIETYNREEDRTVTSTRRPWEDFVPQAAHEISEEIRKEIASASQR